MARNEDSIEVCQQCDWQTALKLIHPAATASTIERFVRELHTGELDSDGLLVMRRHDRIVAGIMVNAMPGAFSSMAFSDTEVGSNANTLERLWGAAEQFLRSRDSALVACMLEAAKTNSLLELVGFRYVARIQTMVCPCNGPKGGKTSSLIFREYDSSDRNLVTSTFDETKDCHRLADSRSSDQVITGFAHCCRGLTDHWYIGRDAGFDVGCLLMSHCGDTVEIVYFGVIVPFRGHGYGRQILEHAIDTSLRLGASQVVAQVDAENDPAMNCYESLGFVCCDSKCLYARNL